VTSVTKVTNDRNTCNPGNTVAMLTLVTER
jgi:hypothetical protein